MFTHVHSRSLMYTHVHWCSLLYTRVHWCSLMFTDVHSHSGTDVHSHSLMYTHVHSRSLMYTHVHSHLLMYTHTHWCSLMFTDVHSHSLMYTHVHCLHSCTQICTDSFHYASMKLLLCIFVYTMYTSVHAQHLGIPVLNHASCGENGFQFLCDLDRFYKSGHIYSWIL